MAEKNPNDKPMKLRTIADLTDAHEWLFNQQRAGQIDAKTADALNTTLKGATYLNARLKLDYAKVILAAKIKKFDFPPGLLPALTAGAE